MQPFDLLEARSFAEACQMLSDGGDDVKALAGGTAMMILAKSGLFAPKALVALKLIGGHNEIITGADGSLHMGALVSQRAIENSAVVKRTHPVLVDAARMVGNIRVRVMSTLGGTLGEADPQADLPGTLMALDAEVQTLSPSGPRTLKVADLYRGIYETNLASDELIVAVRVPPLPEGVNGIYLKHTTGPITDRPTAAVCLLGRVDAHGRVDFLRVVLNALNPTPLRVVQAEALLIGQIPDDSRIEAVAEMASQSCETSSDLRGSEWYKREMARTFTARALRQLFGKE